MIQSPKRLNRKEKEMKSFNSICNKLIQHKNEAAMALAGVGAVPAVAFASGDVAATQADGGAKNMVYNIASVVVNIFPLVGIFFVLAGIFKLVMAYRQDNPEAQSSAAKDIVIGVVFIVFRVFVWNTVKGAIGG